jgi:hypothetical protein
MFFHKSFNDLRVKCTKEYRMECNTEISTFALLFFDQIEFYFYANLH